MKNNKEGRGSLKERGGGGRGGGSSTERVGLFRQGGLFERGSLSNREFMVLTHLPLNHPCRSTSLLPLVTSSVLMVKDNFIS